MTFTPEHPTTQYPEQDLVYPDGSAPTSDYQPSTEDESKDEKKTGFWTRKKIILSLATAAAVGISGGIVAVAVNNSHPTAVAPANPTPSPSTPENTPTPEATMTPEQIIKSLELPATLTPEQLGVLFVEDRLSAWNSMGTNENNLDKYLASGGDVKVIDDIALKNAEIMAEAILPPNWKDIPALVSFVDANKEGNASSIELWMKTSDKNRNDEPYKRWIEAEQPVQYTQDSDTLTITVNAIWYNNADKNRAGDIDPTTLDHGRIPLTIVTTFQDMDGKYKLTSIKASNR